MASKMKIGYIAKYDLGLNPHLKGRFEFKEATYTRKINSRGDKIYSKLLAYPFDYEEVADNADIMKKNESIILVQEPFLLDDELREKLSNGLNGQIKQTLKNMTRGLNIKRKNKCYIL